MKKDLKYYSEKFEYYSYYLQQSINSIGFSYHGKKVDLIQEVYLSLLNRIGINIASIHHLSKIFYEENVSSSIALLFRACISDMILGYYLLDLKNDLNTFEGELKVKDAEFLRYVLKVSPMEQKMLEHKNGESNFDFNGLIFKEFECLINQIDGNGNFIKKSNSLIRTEYKSNPKLIGNKLDFKLTEEEMFKRLIDKESPLSEVFFNIYILWRYYSQFQHYTFYGRILIRDRNENFLYYFIETLFDIYNFLSVIQKFVFEVSIENFDQYKKDLKQIFEEYKPDQLKSPT